MPEINTTRYVVIIGKDDDNGEPIFMCGGRTGERMEFNTMMDAVHARDRLPRSYGWDDTRVVKLVHKDGEWKTEEVWELGYNTISQIKEEIK